MLSERLLREMNDQIKYEMFSANYYLAMAAWCHDQNLSGFANFFKVQAQEENMHAMKFFSFIDELGQRVKIQGMDEPKNDFESLLSVFEAAYEHEQFVTKRIHLLMEIAQEEKNFPAISFLNWFVDEQVEEEDNMRSIVDKIKLVGDKGHVLYMLDREAGTRAAD
jgi:ferritin